MSKSRRFLRFGYLASVIVALGMVVDPARGEKTTPPSDEAVEKTKVQLAAKSEEKKPSKESWASRLDGVFGAYIVKPLGTVLFYDFGSGDKTDHGFSVVIETPNEDTEVELTLAELKAQGNKGKKVDFYGKFEAFVVKSVTNGTLKIGTNAATATAWVADANDTIDALNHAFWIPTPNSDGKQKAFKVEAKTHKGWIGESGVPFVVLWLFLGAIFFTVRMAFINFRGFWHAVRLTKGDYDKPGDEGEVSHFQALASALSATVGLGNIAGVAIAVGMGGPGAVFWIVVVGLLGMSSKFAECTLGQLYRKVAADGTVSGGPMHYLKDGLAELNMPRLGKVLAVMFAVLCILASFGGGNAFQIVQSLGALQANFHQHDSKFLDTDHYAWVYGLIMAILVGVVIIGGIRRIGAAAGKIVPLMCGVYMLTALYVLLYNFPKIPEAFQLILNGAFTPEGVKGGFIGVLVIGIQRAVFSNEAGIGSASIAHSAAKTDEPVSEGIVALLEPFIDTVVVCTMTGLVIVITGAYVKTDPTYGPILTDAGGIKGAALTMIAMGSVVSWFPWVLCAAVMLFAYSTLISWSYYGERCSVMLFGPKASLPYKILFVICAFLGSLLSAAKILDFSDLMILSMAFPNILGVVLLSGKVKRALDDYWGRYKTGEIQETKSQTKPESK